jgi:Fe-S oxidoreductase
MLKAFCSDFVEMTPNRQDNICCGGGGGTVSLDEAKSFRMLVGGRAKAEQIKATGAKYCVAPCANCKKQLRELMEEHGIDCQIVGLHDMLYKAIEFDQAGDE